MGHSAASHLDLDLADYDREIRRLVPAYERMREVQLQALALRLEGGGRRTVLDLGGGTGSLAEAIAERFDRVRIEIWDTDPDMLEVARRRCARFGARIRRVRRSFTEPLPPCDAVAACISLHHVKDLAVKGRIYRHVFAALRPGGLFVNADAAMAGSGPLREAAFARWSRDMQARGIAAPEARRHFALWAKEDYYPPLATEFLLLQKAGFAEPDCFWRDGPAAVFGGLKLKPGSGPRGRAGSPPARRGGARSPRTRR